MKIADLMQELAALFPAHLKDQHVIDAWAKQYKDHLREGPNLERAFRGTMGVWNKTTPPKPADIQLNWPSAANDTDDDTGRFSTGKMWKWIEERIDQKTADIMIAAYARGLTKCPLCKDGTKYDNGDTFDFPRDCRCSAWNSSRDIAVLFLQREYHIERGAARINFYANDLSNKDIEQFNVLHRGE